ncbi:DNA-3-methyladenine glycosylase 2 family protein [Streptomyces sp. NPDC004539]|uniref:DNA-3-methyladenine glycosylase family protein n=1 Tax=Streptomyces sp. NPDC004539 TaxID=3154280 RepID=UPI0033A4E6B2
MAGRFGPRVTRTTVRGGDVVVPAGRGVGLARAGRVRSYVPPGPVDLGLVLGPLRRGPGDPTFRVTPDGAVWRGSLTPCGPGALRVSLEGGVVRGEAWGAGAEWMLDQLPALVGGFDDPSVFVPRHRVVAEVWRRREGLRLGRTGLVVESLIPSVLEQKVTTVEAYRAWGVLVRKFGERAPGPAAGGWLWVMPAPRVWGVIPSWEWHLAGVDEKRAGTVVRAVRVAARLEEGVGVSAEEACRRLESVVGVGVWTSAEVVQRSHGAVDVVTVGDLHLPGVVGWVLGGERGADDRRMLELLEPYAGQRHRAVRLVLLSGRGPERRGPRMPVGDIRGL